MRYTLRPLYRTLLVVILLVTVIIPSGFAAERKTIGLAEFQTETSAVDSALAPLVTSILTEGIITNRSFRVLDQESLSNALAASGLTAATLYDKSGDLQPGQIPGIHYLVTGKIKDAEASVVETNGFHQLRVRVLLSLRIINAVTGNVVFAEAATGEAQKTFLLDKKDSDPINTPANRSKAYEEAVRKAVAKVSAKLNALNPMTGLVLSVNETDKTVTIDLGSEQGASQGQQYRVFIEGNAIVHPSTNMEIGRETRDIATLKVTKAYSQYAVAEIVSGSLAEIHPGQGVSKIQLP